MKKNGSSSYIEYSPALKKKMKLARERTEKRWAAKSSPVTVTYRDDRPSGAPAERETI